jgi:hypothetical protein
MQDEFTEVVSTLLLKRSQFFKYARRAITGVYWVVGGVANVLGIYGFGESHHWWGFKFAPSPEIADAFWMLAVGVGGPWAMMLGGLAGAKLSEMFTRDRVLTSSITRSCVRVGFFFALFHCSEMSFGIRIFPRYLNSNGFVKVSSVYLAVGLAIGVVFPLVIHAGRRFYARNSRQVPRY